MPSQGCCGSSPSLGCGFGAAGSPPSPPPPWSPPGLGAPGKGSSSGSGACELPPSPPPGEFGPLSAGGRFPPPGTRASLPWSPPPPGVSCLPFWVRSEVSSPVPVPAFPEGPGTVSSRGPSTDVRTPVPSPEPEFSLWLTALSTDVTVSLRAARESVIAFLSDPFSAPVTLFSAVWILLSSSASVRPERASMRARRAERVTSPSALT